MTDYSPDPATESEHDIRAVKEAIELALSIFDPPDPHDAALMLIGKAILRDDFDSVLVLCEKCLSSGANQILRGCSSEWLPSPT
jgi:hypothetical protein